MAVYVSSQLGALDSFYFPFYHSSVRMKESEQFINYYRACSCVYWYWVHTFLQSYLISTVFSNVLKLRFQFVQLFSWSEVLFNSKRFSYCNTYYMLGDISPALITYKLACSWSKTFMLMKITGFPKMDPLLALYWMKLNKDSKCRNIICIFCSKKRERKKEMEVQI